jgi:XRE family transcriptional regulator, regulator of sulfur utilization
MILQRIARTHGALDKEAMENALGLLIKRARETRGWTQDELAERMDVNRGYIGQLEAGTIKLPRGERLAQLEQLLGISREDMLRAAGRLGPATEFDLWHELRRISAMQDLDDRVAALEHLPPEVLQILEDLAVDFVRHAVPRSRE